MMMPFSAVIKCLNEKETPNRVKGKMFDVIGVESTDETVYYACLDEKGFFHYVDTDDAQVIGYYHPVRKDYILLNKQKGDDDD